MVRFLADENRPEGTRNDILRGLIRRVPAVDVVRAQDAATGLATEEDPVVLEWAARTGRVVLTHDVQTMPAYAYGRLEAGLPMAGLLVVPRTVTTREAIDDLVLVAECSLEGEWEAQVRFLPL